MCTAGITLGLNVSEPRTGSSISQNATARSIITQNVHNIIVGIYLVFKAFNCYWPQTHILILSTRYPIIARALGLAFRPSAHASKGILHTTQKGKGRLQRTSTKISDFQTTPFLCPGVSEFPKPPLPGRPRPDFSIFTLFLNFYTFLFLLIG